MTLLHTSFPCWRLWRACVLVRRGHAVLGCRSGGGGGDRTAAYRSVSSPLLSGSLSPGPWSPWSGSLNVPRPQLGLRAWPPSVHVAPTCPPHPWRPDPRSIHQWRLCRSANGERWPGSRRHRVHRMTAVTAADGWSLSAPVCSGRSKISHVLTCSMYGPVRRQSPLTFCPCFGSQVTYGLRARSQGLRVCLYEYFTEEQWPR